MEINARITILFERDGLNIRIVDEDSWIEFISLHLDPEQTTSALSRLAHTNVHRCQIQGLARVGKKMQHNTFEFAVPGAGWENRRPIAIAMVDEVCPNDWTPDKSFNSQDSFFERDGQVWARTTIRRWVDRDE